MKKLMVLVVSLFSLVMAQAEPVWIDVRSEAEYAQDHIEGDLRISDDIVARIAEQFPDKDTEIHFYCRSGGRAGRAAEALTAAGYTRVFNAGGIADARSERGL